MPDEKKSEARAISPASALDPFSAVELDRGLRERISFACGATGLPEPMLQRARRGERRALGLLAKLIGRRRREMTVHVIVTGEEIASLLAGRPMTRGQVNRRFKELIAARTEGKREAILMVDRIPRGQTPAKSAQGEKVVRNPREFPERLTVVDVAPPGAGLSELQILPEQEETEVPTAVYVRCAG